jgi:hypothetical protein
MMATRPGRSAIFRFGAASSHRPFELAAADIAVRLDAVGVLVSVDGAPDPLREPPRRRCWVRLTTAKHLNFTDWSWLVPALSARGLRPHIAKLGPINGARALARAKRSSDA